jgi:hypothetical protein
LQNREPTTERQGNAGERNQKSTIAKNNFHQAAFISHWH